MNLDGVELFFLARHLRVRLWELSPEIAVEASRLRWEHRDLADRIIVATALLLRAPVATKDERIASFPAVRTVW